MILISAPKFDQATSITKKYSKAIRDHAEEEGWSFQYLDGEDATPGGIRDALEEADEGFFFLDHGNYKQLIGQDGDPAVDLKNADLLSDLVVDVLACQSARDLGPKAIEEDSRAYIGYDEVAFIVDDPEWKRILNKSKIELLNGKSARKAYEEQKGEMEKECRQSKCPFRKFVQWVKDKFAYVNPLTLEMMCWNLAHYKMLGDSNAKL